MSPCETCSTALFVLIFAFVSLRPCTRKNPRFWRAASTSFPALAIESTPLASRKPDRLLSPARHFPLRHCPTFAPGNGAGQMLGQHHATYPAVCKKVVFHLWPRILRLARSPLLFATVPAAGEIRAAH